MDKNFAMIISCKITTIMLIILLIITTLLISIECLPIFPKSLAPIWISDNPIKVNKHINNIPPSTLPSSSSSNTTTNRSIHESNGQIIRHILSLPMKKNFDFGREWNDVILPFSILYINSQRAVHSTFRMNRMKNLKKHVSSNKIIPTTTIKPQGNHKKIRNENSEQSRRHYSIIPELFMSYGWGLLGK